MVFLVEMSCLMGKLPITKSDCRETNLCHGHSKGVAIPIEKPKAQTTHDDHHQYAHESPAYHTGHEHDDHVQEHQHHHSATIEHEEESIPDETKQHTSCEAHDDHEPEVEGTEFAVAIDRGLASIESCCIDDSVRFFSTPTYFQSNDTIAPLQVPQIAFCEIPCMIWNSLEDKAASFKPPENEKLPSFSRFERFQVFLI